MKRKISNLSKILGCVVLTSVFPTKNIKDYSNQTIENRTILEEKEKPIQKTYIPSIDLIKKTFIDYETLVNKTDSTYSLLEKEGLYPIKNPSNPRDSAMQADYNLWKNSTKEEKLTLMEEFGGTFPNTKKYDQLFKEHIIKKYSKPKQ